MPLVVEDGTGKVNADSYNSIEELDAWLESRGYTTWGPILDTEKEWCARRATDFMTWAYRKRWAGQRVTAEQRLDWPRAWVPNKDVPGLYGAGPAYYPNDEVPEAVKAAHAMLAYRAAHGPLRKDTGRVVKSSTVGEISVTYADDAVDVTKYPEVEEALDPFFGGSELTGTVLRA